MLQVEYEYQTFLVNAYYGKFGYCVRPLEQISANNLSGPHYSKNICVFVHLGLDIQPQIVVQNSSRAQSTQRNKEKEVTEKVHKAKHLEEDTMCP